MPEIALVDTVDRALLTSYLTSYLSRFQDSSMKSWPVQDAKARFSELLETCLRDGPQVVTRRGADTAVLVPMNYWLRAQSAAKPTLKDLLLSDDRRGDLNIRRGGFHRRKPRALA